MYGTDNSKYLNSFYSTHKTGLTVKKTWVSLHSKVLIPIDGGGEIDHIKWPEKGSFVQWIS